jgi:secondary thiamine-phosphate synthase enzyme
MHRFSVRTNNKRQVIDLTGEVNTFISEQGFADGLCNVFVLHTTAALTTADLDPGTDQDYLDALAKMIPDLKYRHPHDPEHTPDHILAALIGPSVTIPVERGRLVLGTWQRVVLFEFDGPREREIVLSLI